VRVGKVLQETEDGGGGSGFRLSGRMRRMVTEFRASSPAFSWTAAPFSLLSLFFVHFEGSFLGCVGREGAPDRGGHAGTPAEG